jgi:hypothetical protein
MKQKYLLLKNDEKKELLIKEFAESDKESFAVIDLYNSENDNSVELFFNDIDLLVKD